MATRRAGGRRRAARLIKRTAEAAQGTALNAGVHVCALCRQSAQTPPAGAQAEGAGQLSRRRRVCGTRFSHRRATTRDTHTRTRTHTRTHAQTNLPLNESPPPRWSLFRFVGTSTAIDSPLRSAIRFRSIPTCFSDCAPPEVKGRARRTGHYHPPRAAAAPAAVATPAAAHLRGLTAPRAKRISLSVRIPFGNRSGRRRATPTPVLDTFSFSHSPQKLLLGRSTRRRAATILLSIRPGRAK